MFAATSVSFTPVYWYEESIPINLLMIFMGFFIAVSSLIYTYRKSGIVFKDIEGASFYDFLTGCFGIFVGFFLAVVGCQWLIN